LLSSKTYLQPAYEVSFDVGFPVRHKFNGTYIDKTDSTEYIYFADPVTYKIIKFFTIDGQVKWQTPLDSILTDGNTIAMISVISADTIIGLADHYNILYFLDRNGKCWKKIDLTPLLDRTGLESYILNESLFDDFLTDYKNTLVFGTALDQDWRGAFQSSFKLQACKVLYRRGNNSCQIIKIENVFDTININGGIKYFYPDTTGNYNYSEPSHYCLHENKLYMFSIYFNNIYIINIENLDVESIHKVKSKFTKIGYPPIEVTEYFINNFPKEANQKAKTLGRFDHLYFDNYTNRFMLSIMHEKPLNSVDSLVGGNRSWSLMILDTLFNILDEIYFEPKKFLTDIIPCKEGVLISNNWQEWSKYEKTKARFVLFKWNE
jgi:hypothetical protein